MRNDLMVLTSVVAALCSGCRKPEGEQVVRQTEAPAEAAEPAEPSVDRSRCDGMKAYEKLEICGPEGGQDAWAVESHKLRGQTGAAAEGSDCYASLGASGQSEYLPPLSATCRLGPKMKCVATEKPARPWEYVVPTDPTTSLWALVDAVQGGVAPRSSYAHHRVKWSRSGDICTSVLESVADLDGDRFYSTYEDGSIFQLPDGKSVGQSVRAIRIPECAAPEDRDGSEAIVYCPERDR